MVPNSAIARQHLVAFEDSCGLTRAGRYSALAEGGRGEDCEKGDEEWRAVVRVFWDGSHPIHGDENVAEVASVIVCHDDHCV